MKIKKLNEELEKLLERDLFGLHYLAEYRGQECLVACNVGHSGAYWNWKLYEFLEEYRSLYWDLRDVF